MRVAAGAAIVSVAAILKGSGYGAPPRSCAAAVLTMATALTMATVLTMATGLTGDGRPVVNGVVVDVGLGAPTLRAQG